jgi:hypothetical protein
MATTLERPITATDAARPRRARQIWRAGFITAGAAVVANVLVYVLAGALGVAPLVRMGGPAAPLEVMPVAPVIVVTLVPALVATALFALLNRFTRRPVAWFVGIAAVVLALSFGPTLALPIPVASQAVLSLMHIVAAAVTVGGLIILTRDR